MLTVSKSVVLGAAFLAGVAIAACADPLCRTPIGPCRPPGPQIAALPSADAASAPDNVTRPEVNVFEPQPPGQDYCACFSSEAEPHP
jgi:hypothetical protein